MLRGLGRAILLGVFLMVAGQNTSGITLRDALAANQVDFSGLPAAQLGLSATSYACINHAQFFLIAYFPYDGAKYRGETINLALQKRSDGTWLTRELRQDDPKVGVFGNSINALKMVSGFFYIDTHYNPSASFTLVVDSALEFRGVIFGWPVAWFEDSLVVFHNSQVHFAPTHHVEMSVYDPRNKKQWQIYPMKPYQPVRQQQVEKVRAEYQRRGDAWFREHNHHGDPELFDNYLHGEVAANDATHSIAFVIAFDNTDTWDYADKLKLQNFGGMGHALAGFDLSAAPPEGIFEVFGQGLQAVMQANLQDAFLRLFERDETTQELLRKAFATGAEGHADWRQRLVAVDVRWGRPEIWRKIQATLATPPETTEVVCIFRNLDQDSKSEYREILLVDFQKKFGDKPLAEFLEREMLDRIFTD